MKLSKYNKKELYRYIETPEDLAFLKQDDVFHISNGLWYGKIDSQTLAGVTLSMYDDYSAEPVREHVFYPNDAKLDWTIDAVYMPINIQDMLRTKYQHLCQDFGKETVDIAIRNLQNEPIPDYERDEE